jgi:hypothetical protein
MDALLTGLCAAPCSFARLLVCALARLLARSRAQLS